VLDGTEYSIKLTVKKGAFTANGAELQVSESGLYHITVDLNSDGAVGAPTIIIAPVTAWAIDKGTGGTWAVGSFDKTTIAYTLTEQTIANLSKFKFQYGEGWKIPLSENVKAETSLGGTADKPTPTGSEIVIRRGIYTIKLTWTLAESVEKSFIATITKTESLPDLPFEDNVTYSLIGDAVGGWDTDVDFTFVSNTNNHIVYKIEPITLLAGTFKARQHGTWEGAINYGYDDLPVEGLDASNVDGNIYTTTGGTFSKVTFEFDWDSEILNPKLIFVP
jgi:hypothetical protein